MWCSGAEQIPAVFTLAARKPRGSVAMPRVPTTHFFLNQMVINHLNLFTKCWCMVGMLVKTFHGSANVL